MRIDGNDEPGGLSMLPIIGIAAAILPDLIKLIAGDKAGTVASDVAKAVTDATKTDDPVKAKAAVDADPKVAADLQAKLAQIAVDATKVQNEAAAQQRKDELAELQVRLQADAANTSGARSLQQVLAQTGSSVAWVPAGVSACVILGFVVVVAMIMAPKTWGLSVDANNQLLNICVGALVAGFTTVISFWLGSSQGSRDKDTSSLQLQASQSAQATQVITAQSDALKTATARAAPAAPAGMVAAVLTPANDPSQNFGQCMPLVFTAEGGYVNDPQDPGKATNLGITIATLTAWRKRHDPAATVSDDDVRNLTKEEATEIYRTNYWNPMQCGALPKGLDLVVFDFGVNAGPGRAAMTLQTAVGVKADGSIGPITLAALGAIPQKDLINGFCAKRLAYYQSLADFPRFGAGWTSRTQTMQQAALAMVG